MEAALDFRRTHIDGTPIARAPRPTPWYLLPIVLPLRLVAFVLGLAGRFLAIVLGLALLAGGAIFTATLIGAPLGIPLCMLGLVLVLRALF